MTIALSSAADQKGWLVLTLTGAASTANGGLGEFANPEGVPLGIIRAFMYARTGSTGAANLNIGVGASAAAVNDICSAMSVIQADCGGDLTFLPAAQVAETDSPTAIWTAATFLVFTGSATTVGLDADIYIEYIRLDA